MVMDELEEIVNIVPPECLIPLGNTDQPDFDGLYTTVKNVVERLPNANVLHLACHGTQSISHPLDSKLS